MRILVAADLHGYKKYVQLLDAVIERFNPDKIILLGDLLSYVTVDEEVIQILNKHQDKIIAVRGNCDSDFVLNELQFDASSIYKEVDIDGFKFILTHGHMMDLLDTIIKDKYCLCGHTHVYNLDGQFINPGSVGSPRVNPEHTCLLYEDKVFNLYDLDTDEVIKKRTLE